MHLVKRVAAIAASGLAGLAMTAGAALATGPQPWELNFQPPATPVMDRLDSFHDMLLVITTLITLFVLGLLVYVMVRFRESRNPKPSRTTHHTVVEIVWTVVPVMILVAIAIPSLRILYYMDRAADAEMTVKAIGHQWYWSYEYPDHGNFTFDAYLVPDNELKDGQKRLLETDNRVVLPVDTTIRVLVTATEVLHSWAVPAFGFKQDAVPGRINESWIRIEREGTYYGQCSELCGKDHGYMPITIEAVSKEAFARWAEEAKTKFAGTGGTAAVTAVASADR